jgi:glutathione S-transferase
MLELYHYWDSVCSFKVRMCLAEKGLNWESRYVDILAFEQTRPDYLKLNPNAVVPTLVHDGRPVIESTVINEYLDEVFPDMSLRPADPHARARMRVWVKYEDDLIYPAIRIPSFNLMLRSILTQRTDAEIDRMMATHPDPKRAENYKKTARAPVDRAAVAEATQKLAVALDRLEATLADGPWLVGAQFTLADIALAPMMDRLEFLAMAGLWDGRPRVRDWVARLKARPSYKAAEPPAEHRVPGPLAVA